MQLSVATLDIYAAQINYSRNFRPRQLSFSSVSANVMHISSACNTEFRLFVRQINTLSYVTFTGKIFVYNERLCLITICLSSKL